MPFTAFNYASPELQKSPINDIIKGLMTGYTDTTKAQFLRPTLQEQLKKSQLQNQYYGPNIESQIGLRGAQAGHLGAMTQGLNISNPFLRKKLEQEQEQRQFGLENPFFGQTGTSGDLGRLLSLQKMIQSNPELAGHLQSQQPPPSQQSFGEGQSYIPSIQQQSSNKISNPLGGMDFNQLLQDAFSKVASGKDKQFAPSNIGKLQKELREAQEGHYPGTNIPFESEQAKEEFTAPLREKLGGLKSGEHYIYDPETHEKIGQERPYTAKERETEEGRAFFNEIFPTINKSTEDFVGKDSIKNFLKYAGEYGKNESATHKIDDLLLGQKLIASGVVKEAATLGAGKTNQTYNRLEKTFSKSDLPPLIERYGKELKLPTDAFVKAGVRFNQILNTATDKASNSIPPTKKLYFHPEEHLKSKEEQKEHLEQHDKTITIRNKKTGKEETVSLEEARKRGIKDV